MKDDGAIKYQTGFVRYQTGFMKKRMNKNERWGWIGKEGFAEEIEKEAVMQKDMLECDNIAIFI